MINLKFRACSNQHDSTPDPSLTNITPPRGEKLGDVWYSVEPMGVNTYQLFTQITAPAALPSRNWLKLDWKEQRQSVYTGPRFLSRATGHLIWITEHSAENLLCAGRENNWESFRSQPLKQDPHGLYETATSTICNFNGSMPVYFYRLQVYCLL